MPSMERKSLEVKKTPTKNRTVGTSEAFWEQVKSIISEYYEFIIADIIKGVFSELPPNLNVGDLLNEIKTDFMAFWQQYFIPSSESYSTREKTLGLNLRHAMIDTVKRYNILGDVMGDFIVNTLVQMSVDLKGLIIEKSSFAKKSQNQISLQLDKEYMNYLQNLVNEYVLVTYLDHFIVAQAIKIIFYLENIGFGEVYELRQKIIEFFRDFIYNTQKITEFRNFLSENVDQLNISINSLRLFEKILFGYFSTIIQHKHDPKMFDFYKDQIRHRMILVKSNLVFPTREKKDIVMDWIKKQIQIILHFSSSEGKNRIQTLQAEIMALFSEAINSQMDVETFDEKLDELDIDLLSDTEEFMKDSKNQEKVKNSIENESSSGISSYDKLFNKVVYSDEDVLSLDASELPSTTSGIIRALGHMVLTQIESDLTLERLVTLIQELDKESLPGGNEYYI